MDNLLMYSKKEFTIILCNILTEELYKGINSLWLKSKEETARKPSDTFSLFQKKLSNIPKWNEIVIGKEYQRIITHKTNETNFNNLLKKLFLINTQLLVSDKQSQIKIKVPTGEKFLHQCYIECSYVFFKNALLMEDRDNKISIKDRYSNFCTSLKLISECIENSIRNQLPLDDILNSEKQSNEEIIPDMINFINPSKDPHRTQSLFVKPTYEPNYTHTPDHVLPEQHHTPTPERPEPDYYPEPERSEHRLPEPERPEQHRPTPPEPERPEQHRPTTPEPERPDLDHIPTTTPEPERSDLDHIPTTTTPEPDHRPNPEYVPIQDHRPDPEQDDIKTIDLSDTHVKQKPIDGIKLMKNYERESNKIDIDVLSSKEEIPLTINTLNTDALLKNINNNNDDKFFADIQ